MAQVLKADVAGLSQLKQQRELLKQAKQKLSRKWQWFLVGAGGLLALVGAAYLVHGVSLTTAWVLEGYIFALLLWWMLVLVPAQLTVSKVERQVESVRSGLQGELAVGRALAKLPDDHVVLHDVTVMSDEFNHTQLDHVVITPEKLLCIETKNWHGTYYPGQGGWLWTAIGNIRKRKRHAHKDPVQQSHMHSAALKRILAQAEIAVEIQPLVVLSDPESTWQGKQEETCPVLNLEDLLPYVIGLKTQERTGAQEKQLRIAEAILYGEKGETENR